MKKIILSLLLFISISNCFAQFDNSPFYRSANMDSTLDKSLLLNISLLNFNKDNEYFNNISDGYTLFGNHLSASLAYHPTSYTMIEGGINLRKDFGNNQYQEVSPVLRAVIKHKKSKFVFGSLYGNVNHQLIEPLYDFERVMTNNQEEGIQFIVDKKKYWSDTWVYWEKMLYAADTIQEVVSGGTSMLFKLVDKPTLSFSIPVQFTALHRGGQIDISNTPLTTIFNAATGFKIEKKWNHSFFKSLSLEPYGAFYHNYSFVVQTPYTSGAALYLNSTLKTKLNSIMVSYWQGNKFQSAHGGGLYSSASSTVNYSYYTEDVRQLILVRFLTDIKVAKDFSLTTRFEPVFDLNFDKFEFSMGLYINYDSSFLLKKIKP